MFQREKLDVVLKELLNEFGIAIDILVVGILTTHYKDDYKYEDRRT